jgi:hypothetical protein
MGVGIGMTVLEPEEPDPELTTGVVGLGEPDPVITEHLNAFVFHVWCSEDTFVIKSPPSKELIISDTPKRGFSVSGTPVQDPRIYT